MNHIYLKRLHLTLCLIIGFGCLTYGQKKQGRKTAVKDSTILDTNKLVPVNIAYDRQPRTYIIESISTVTGESLNKTFNTNLGNVLNGRIAGLTVAPGSNEPGINTPALYSRGLSTFANGSALGTSTSVGSSTAPLIVLDGFISDYSQLVPEEIQQISLLKDAAATAMYGMRAANGVLLITTKRGYKSPLKINFGTLQGFSQASYLPKFMDAYGYAALYNEALENDGKPRKYTSDDLSAYLNNTDPVFHPNVNWYDQVLRKSAPLANYNINFRGGTDIVKYYVLLNAVNQGGLYKNFGDQDRESSNATYNRYNFRTNIDVSVNKDLQIALTLGGTVENKSNPAAYNTANLFNYLTQLPPNSFPVLNPNGTYSGTTTLSNPVATLLKTGFYSTNGRTLTSSLRLTQKLDAITPGLAGSAAVSSYSYFTSYSNKSKQVQLTILGKDATGNSLYSTTGNTTSLVGSESQSDQFSNLILQGQIDYSRKFGKSAISLVNNFNAESYNVSYAAVATDGLNSQPFAHNSVSGRLNYVYNDRFTGEFSYAYMGATDFPVGNRYGFFPAGAIGWIASNEGFLKNNPVLSFLKVRASYGLVGNDNLNSPRRYYYNPYVGYVAQYYFGTGNAVVNSLAEAPYNPNITWEKQKTANIGLNATLFGTLDFSFDYFRNNRYDILVSSTNITPQYIGKPIASVNQGKMLNRGFEASVTYNTNPTKKVKGYVSANFSYAKNKVVYNAEAPQINNYQLQAANPYGGIRGYVATGFFNNAQEIQSAAKPVGIVIQPGDIKYQDLGGPNGKPDGIIDQYDTKLIGKSNIPEFTGGINAGISYAGFDADIVLQGVTGRSIYTGNSYTQSFQGNISQISALAINRWTPATAATADYPRLSTNGNQNNYQVSSFWVKNGDFIKLRSAELGYNFPTAMMSKIKLSGLRLFVQGTNLFSLDHTGKYGTDPETLTGYPPLRTLSLGAKVQLQ